VLLLLMIISPVLRIADFSALLLQMMSPAFAAPWMEHNDFYQTIFPHMLCLHTKHAKEIKIK